MSTRIPLHRIYNRCGTASVDQEGQMEGNRAGEGASQILIVDRRGLATDL